jgi:hypothetical protein
MNIQDSTKHGAAADIQPGEARSSQAVVSRGRRALLKGSAAAVPMVLTLRSGAALAITSAEECVERNINNTTALAVTEAQDVAGNPFVRRRVFARKIQASGGAEFWVYLPPATEEAAGVSSDNPTDVDGWLKENDNLATIAYNTTATSGTAPVLGQMTDDSAPPATYDILELATHYILVRVDATGYPNGEYGASGAGMIIDGSCWASAMRNFTSEFEAKKFAF